MMTHDHGVACVHICPALLDSLFDVLKFSLHFVTDVMSHDDVEYGIETMEK